MITKGLSESKAFQRFAMATHQHVEKAKESIADPQKAEQLLKAARASADAVAGASSSQQYSNAGFAAQFSRFQRALSEEISRDLVRPRK